MNDDLKKIFVQLREVQRDLLKLRLTLLQEKRQLPSKIKTQQAVLSRAPRSENRKLILKFIRGVSEARTKDVVDEFNILSERTVKRNLHELVVEGFLRKQVKDRGVFYIPVEGIRA